MTGGEVLVLGKVGRNFAAGMSGGFAYILDFDKRYGNFAQVEARETSAEDLERISHLIEQHVLYTNSKKGKTILENWQVYQNRFTKIVPIAYEEMNNLIGKYVAEGASREEAEHQAFAEKYRA